MKTFTISLRAKVILSAIITLLVITNVNAQFGTQNEKVHVRIPEVINPGPREMMGDGTLMAPAGSISVAENSTYNAMSVSELVKNVLVTGCLQADNIRFGYYKKNNNNSWSWNNYSLSSNPGDRMIGYFNKGTSNFPIEEGLILSTGKISSAMGPNNSGSYSDKMNANASDPDLAGITNRTMYDAAVLEFDFIPAGNTVEFKYIFASEEYIEYCETEFNDAFGFFLSGPGISGPYTNNAVNLATIPGNIAVSINTIHPSGTNVYHASFPAENAQYYIDNPSGSNKMQFDGSTVELTATYNVIPCQTYRIKMAVADASDQQWDAGVFLSAKSFNSETLTLTHFGNNILNNNNIFEGCLNNKLVVTRQTSDLTEPYTVDILLSGTSVNGTDILTADGQPFPTQITIPAGQATYEIPYYAVNDGTGDNAETFIVKVRNSCPCDANIVYVEKVIHIYENVTISSISATNTLCSGQSNGVITVNASGGSGNYEYSKDNGTSWQTSNTFTGLVAGNYTILVRDPGSCNNPVSGSATVGSPSAIVANAGSDVTICSGLSTQLNGTGGVLYSWSPATGLNNPNIANPIASPATTTTYTLTVTNASGNCASTDQVVVTVNPSPVVIVSPLETEICYGSSATLTASGAATYSWNPGGATTAEISVSPTSNTSYVVTGTGANGCTATATSTIIVNPAPLNVYAGADANIGYCQTYQLQGTANANGSGTLSYSWSPVTGLSNPNIANPIFTPESEGSFTYTLTVTGANGCSNSDEIIIAVAEEISVSVEVVNNSCPATPDGSIHITLSGGTSPFSFSWTGPNDFMSENEDLNNILSGIYQVVITDNNGCSKTETYTVATIPDITAPVITTLAENGDLGCNPTVVAPEFTGTDNCEGSIIPEVTTSGASNNGTSYSQTWTATYTDASGNVAEPVIITYTWTEDTENPILSTTAV
ncbi:MAG: choice-of-anchor L domain-containing protein, partial [Lentimicrobium sp.]|nr:choice-of-anchor L domain-containing protein [Lentimicrobium sp.]